MADLEFEEINRGNQPTQDGAGTDDAWTFTGKIIRNFNKLKAFLADPSNAASRKVGESDGDVLQVGAGNLLLTDPLSLPPSQESQKKPVSFWRALSANTTFPRAVSAISMRYDERRSSEFAVASTHTQGVEAYIRNWDESSDSWGDYVSVIHSGNTTTDSNGFIKEASPIIKLFDDKIEKTDHLEIQSAALEKLGTGKYKLTGVPELSRDGWYIETPKDRNNNIYFTLDYEENNGELIIKTYEPDYSSGRAENGAPVDILEGRFVSLRFAEDPSLYPDDEEEIGEE